MLFCLSAVIGGENFNGNPRTEPERIHENFAFVYIRQLGVAIIELLKNLFLFNIGSKNLVLNNVCMMDVSFPHLLEQEKSLSMYIPCASVAAQMASMVASGEINEKTKVKVLTTDSSGKQYYFKTKYSVESIIKHLSN